MDNTENILSEQEPEKEYIIAADTPETDDAPVQEPAAEPVAAEVPVPEPEAETPAEESPAVPELTVPVTEEAPAKKKRKGHKIWKAVVAAALVVALVAGGCVATAFYMNYYWEDWAYAATQQINNLTEHVVNLNSALSEVRDQMGNTNGGTGNSVSGTPNTSADGLTPGQVYAKTIQGVVAINATVTESSYAGISSGSGFIISEDGYVVTNYHVVEGASKIAVIDCFENEYAATLVGMDSNHDIAVLKVNATGLHPVSIGSSDNLIVGDQVVAIGNALGELSASLTVGYVSGLNRIVAGDSRLFTMIQTDASINSGNSGGPLFNMKGEVVGITTIKYSGTTSSGAVIEGIGFAIPIDDVIPKIWDIVEYGYVTGAYLGVSVQDMDTTVASQYGLPQGVYVADVVVGNCAHAAGVRAKDIILAIGGTSVSCINDLSSVLQRYSAGDTTTITVWRSGQELTLEITLDAKPQE